MALKQANRLLGLNTPLGEDALLLTAFRGREEISRLFHFELFLLSDDNAVAPRDIVGKNVTFRVLLDDGSPRPFNGFVSRFYAGDEDENGRRSYRAVVVPWLWFTTLKTDCRIFQNQDVKQITEKVFGDLGFNDFDVKQIEGHHPKRVYCVQYSETTFAFLSRLWEDEGIFYFFKHEDGKHTLVLGDQKQAYVDCEQKEVDFPRRFGVKREEDVITRWEHRWEFRTGKVAHTDYNFETPGNNLMTSEATVIDQPGMDKFEQYEWPGAYGTTDDGQPLARVRIEEQEAGYDVVEAMSHCRTFTPGGKFKIRKHRSSAEEGKSFVVTAIEHSASEPGAYESDQPAGEGYRNEFECVPDTVVCRPPRVTPKPYSRGPETAIVVGPKGEEIYTDEHGRVKVQFHWDREGKRDENSSCWLRVSQVHAGTGFGGIDIPRIGEEVIVEYFGGDYDRPIITGRVYHAENKPPFSLPGDKNVSGLKTNSTPGGGGSNEISMNDSKGKEQVTIHAQYNMDTTVENDQSTTVHNNRTDAVDADDSETVGGNQSASIGGNQTIGVDGDQSVTVGGSQSTDVTGQQDYAVGAAQNVSVGDARTTNVDANDELTVGGSQTIGVTGPIEITSGDSITLNVGGSSIKIEPAGITISSSKVQIAGTEKVETTGAMIASAASGKHDITGATVNIN